MPISRPTHIVVPAKAGTHLSTARAVARWVPAFAGTTISEVAKRRNFTIRTLD